MKRWSFGWWFVLVTMLLTVAELLNEQYELATYYLALSIWGIVADTNRRTK